ncbi:MAG: LysE family transporter [Selenomonadales bacterium]|nr:LysE family transporter [Selenomonadales bacterium]
MKWYLDGLKFGMLLQLAIGPMCLLVFNTAKNMGFINALSLVSAIALIDAFYIYLAGIGVSRLLLQERVKICVSVIGAFVLCLFGINMILEAVGRDIVLHISSDSDVQSVFVQGLILTLSNPLTIVFWGTVLTQKMIKEQLRRSELIFFSAGLVSATVFFLTGIAILGTEMKEFLPDTISNGLNVVVGVVIVYFGIKMFLNKQ